MQQQVAAKLAGPRPARGERILSLIQHPTSPQYVVLAKGVSAQDGNAITALTCPASRSDARATPGPIPTATPRPTSSASPAPARRSWPARQGSSSSTTRCWPGRRAASRCRSARRPADPARGQQRPAGGQRQRPAADHRPGAAVRRRAGLRSPGGQDKASNCTVVIIQPKTGYVLAMAQWPTYDPSTSPT